MISTLSVLLYGRPINNAVIRIPDRRNPGVLIQADTLSALVGHAADVVKMIKDRHRDDGELVGEGEALFENLSTILDGLKLEIERVGEQLDV